MFKDHSGNNVENVLEVVQAAGWETSHWRVMLSGNDGSLGQIPREIHKWNRQDGWPVRKWKDLELCRLTEVTARCLSCEWLEGRLQVGWQACGKGWAGVRNPALTH